MLKKNAGTRLLGFRSRPAVSTASASRLSAGGSDRGRDPIGSGGDYNGKGRVSDDRRGLIPRAERLARDWGRWKVGRLV